VVSGADSLCEASGGTGRIASSFPELLWFCDRLHRTRHVLGVKCRFLQCHASQVAAVAAGSKRRTMSSLGVSGKPPQNTQKTQEDGVSRSNAWV